MSQQQIPLDASPNQTWQATVSINGGTFTFFVALSYNEIAQYWSMSISDSNQNLLVAGLPLVTGLNLLKQFGYLNIGSLYVVNASNVATPNFPNSVNLGTDFTLVWSDNA